MIKIDFVLELGCLSTVSDDGKTLLIDYAHWRTLDDTQKDFVLLHGKQTMDMKLPVPTLKAEDASTEQNSLLSEKEAAWQREREVLREERDKLQVIIENLNVETGQLRADLEAKQEEFSKLEREFDDIKSDVEDELEQVIRRVRAM